MQRSCGGACALRCKRQVIRKTDAAVCSLCGWICVCRSRIFPDGREKRGTLRRLYGVMSVLRDRAGGDGALREKSVNY